MLDSGCAPNKPDKNITQMALNVSTHQQIVLNLIISDKSDPTQVSPKNTKLTSPNASSPKHPNAYPPTMIKSFVADSAAMVNTT